MKANAYGIGASEAAKVLHGAGTRDFFVAHWSEVAAVAAKVPSSQISVLHGLLSPDEAAYCRAIGVRPVINSLRQAKLWLDAGGGACDLMVDTGINRLGLPLADIGNPLIAALEIDILLSHLASADEVESPQNEQQLERFVSACGAVSARRRSFANSAGIALGSRYQFDLTRPGIALYGGVPNPAMAEHIAQVAYLEAALIQTRELSAGDKVGYNALFTADRSMRVGVVSVGYADGFLRSWTGRGALQHGEARLPLLGRVSMDMVVVDMTQAPRLVEGDWVSVPYNLPEAALASGLSQYELLTVLGQRFSRI